MVSACMTLPAGYFGNVDQHLSRHQECRLLAWPVKIMLFDDLINDIPAIDAISAAVTHRPADSTARKMSSDSRSTPLNRSPTSSTAWWSWSLYIPRRRVLFFNFTRTVDLWRNPWSGRARLAYTGMEGPAKLSPYTPESAIGSIWCNSSVKTSVVIFLCLYAISILWPIRYHWPDLIATKFNTKESV